MFQCRTRWASEGDPTNVGAMDPARTQVDVLLEVDFSCCYSARTRRLTETHSPLTNHFICLSTLSLSSGNCSDPFLIGPAASRASRQPMSCAHREWLGPRRHSHCIIWVIHMQSWSSLHSGEQYWYDYDWIALDAFFKSINFAEDISKRWKKCDLWLERACPIKHTISLTHINLCIHDWWAGIKTTDKENDTVHLCVAFFLSMPSFTTLTPLALSSATKLSCQTYSLWPLDTEYPSLWQCWRPHH